MKTPDSFNVEFEYALSENITIELTADVKLLHSEPHYNISNFQSKSNPSTYDLLPDIDIMAVKLRDRISWVHTDSMKETLLSVAIGHAIEANADVEIANLDK
jgi:hypothetical protein